MSQEIESLRTQLAAANAELVRKQDRDSQYSNVCCRLSARENEVVQLREQLAEKDAEIERLTQQRQLWLDTDIQAAALVAQENELAAGQAREQQLREAVRQNHEWHENQDEFGGYSVSELAEVNEQALTLPQDTTALSAMIAKAGEVMRESVIEQCIAMGVMYRDGAFVEEIRALPGVTLEEI